MMKFQVTNTFDITDIGKACHFWSFLVKLYISGLLLEDKQMVKENCFIYTCYFVLQSWLETLMKLQKGRGCDCKPKRQLDIHNIRVSTPWPLHTLNPLPALVCIFLVRKQLFVNCLCKFQLQIQATLFPLTLLLCHCFMFCVSWVYLWFKGCINLEGDLELDSQLQCSFEWK